MSSQTVFPLDLSQFRYSEDDNDEIIKMKIHSTIVEPLSSPTKKNSPIKNKYINENLKCSGNLVEKYFTPGYIEKPLRLIIIGHNPSQKSWEQGHYYANPSNRMWNILRECGIIPINFTHENDDDCPNSLGIGFTDLGTGYPETDSSKISDMMLNEWKSSLYQRLIDHVNRAGASPKIIAFAGIKQFKAIFPSNYFKVVNKKRKLENNVTIIEELNSFIYGIQTILPSDWPKLLKSSIVIVCPSTSGAAAMTNEVRINPYRELSTLLKDIPWPLPTSTKSITNKTNTIEADSSIIEIIELE